MAATTESVKADAAEAPLLNKRNLTLGILFVHSLVRRCLWMVCRLRLIRTRVRNILDEHAVHRNGC